MRIQEETAMAYRIFFSGLMAFVEYHVGEKAEEVGQVDVLLLNPCALHEAGAHKGKGGAHNHEALCDDLHEPELMLKSADIADWVLDGVLQGCGWHHFDLKGKKVFPKPSNARTVKLSMPPSDEFDVDPFGKMQHVSFREGIVDMEKVLKGNGGISEDFQQAPTDPGDFRRMIVAIVRLPPGTLTALAPLANSARSLLGWDIGNQRLESLAEMAMFKPDDQDNGRIDLAPLRAEQANEYVTVRRNRDVTVWITNEPRRRKRTRGQALIEAEHFNHYYRLLPQGRVSMQKVGKVDEPRGPVPTLRAAGNIDNPLCPPCLMRAPKPLG
jgi:hypothetical protein